MTNLLLDKATSKDPKDNQKTMTALYQLNENVDMIDETTVDSGRKIIEMLGKEGNFKIPLKQGCKMLGNFLAADANKKKTGQGRELKRELSNSSSAH